MSHPRNKDYKSGGSPEEDEHKMPVPSKEIVESSDFRAGDELWKIKKVASYEDVVEGEVAAFRATNRPNAIESLKETVEQLKLDMKSSNDEWKKKVVSLGERLDELSIEYVDVLMDRIILNSEQTKRMVEASICETKISNGSTPKFGELYKLDLTLSRIKDTKKQASLLQDPIIDKFMQINNNERYARIFTSRHTIAHPMEIDFKKLDSMFARMKKEEERLRPEEKEIIESAEDLVKDLKNLPDIDKLVKHFQDVISKRKPKILIQPTQQPQQSQEQQQEREQEQEQEQQPEPQKQNKFKNKLKNTFNFWNNKNE